MVGRFGFCCCLSWDFEEVSGWRRVVKVFSFKYRNKFRFLLGLSLE